MTISLAEAKGNCEYCPETHTYEPCGLCGHVHLHERCKAVIQEQCPDCPAPSYVCACCCYMTAAQAAQDLEDQQNWLAANIPGD